MTVTIGPLTEDAEILGFRDCVATLAREGRWLNTLEGYPLDKTTAYIAEMRADGLPPILARAGERVVGWADVRRLDGVQAHAGTFGMGLLADWRGRGLGRSLAEQALAQARAAGLARIDLEVFATNTRAQHLYHRLGFAVEGVRRLGARLPGLGAVDIIQMGLLFDAVPPQPDAGG